MNAGDRQQGPVAKRTKGRDQISTRARSEVSAFLATAVMPSTVRTYNAHFKAWTQFLKDEVDCDDPFMTDTPEEEKVFLVSLMMCRRHQAGHKGKAATAFTAALKREFVIAMIALLVSLQNSINSDSVDSTILGSQRRRIFITAS